MRRKRKIPHVAMCSGGKDSVATLILCKIHNLPLDEVIYAEVMWDSKTSGEVPEHRNFVYETLKPWVESELGVPFTIVRGQGSFKSYVEFIKHPISKGPNKGYPYGLVLAGRCSMNKYGKLMAIQPYLQKTYPQGANQYVGIAHDEKSRLDTLNKQDRRISLLDRYKVSEADAAKLCKQFGLYSPIYEYSNRNGCWFCPNCKNSEIVHLVNNHPDLVDKLLKMETWCIRNQAKYPHWKYGKSFKSKIKTLQRRGLIGGVTHGSS